MLSNDQGHELGELPGRRAKPQTAALGSSGSALLRGRKIKATRDTWFDVLLVPTRIPLSDEGALTSEGCLKQAPKWARDHLQRDGPDIEVIAP
jgi:hypothetical protein